MCFSFNNISRYVLFFMLFSVRSIASAQKLKLMVPLSHNGEISSLDFSPDSKYLVTAGSDAIKTWHVPDGNLLNDTTIGSVQSVLFTPDGKHMILSFYRTKIEIWKFPEWKKEKEITGYGTYLTTSMSKDGKYFAINFENSLQVRRTSDWEIEKEIKYRFTRKPKFSDDNKCIVALCKDNIVRVWQIDNASLIAELKGHTGLQSAEFNKDGKYIVSAGDNSAKVWRVSDSKLIANFAHSNFVNAARFMPDENFVITNVYKSTETIYSPILNLAAKVWKIDGERMEYSLNAYSPPHANTCTRFSPDKKYVLTTFEYEPIKIWQSDNGKLVSRLNDIGMGISSAAAFSPDGKYIASATSEQFVSGVHSIRIWETDNWSITSASNKENTGITDACLSGEGDYLITALARNNIEVWQIKDGKLVANLDRNDSPTRHHGRTDKLLNGKNAGKMITAGQDSLALVWDAVRDTLLFKLGSCRDKVNAAKFDKNEKYILTTTYKGGMRLWNAETGKLIADLLRPDTGLYMTSVKADFSEDGKYIVAATVRMKWDTKTSIYTYDSLQSQLGWINKIFQTSDGMPVKGNVDSLSVVLRSVRTLEGDFIINADIGSNRVTFYKMEDGHIDLKKSYKEFTGEAYSISGDKKWILIYEYGKITRRELNNLGAAPKTILQTGVLKSISTDSKYFIAQKKTSVDFYDLETMELKCSHIPLNDTDYVMKQPSGYYSCTPNAAKILHYVTDDVKLITFDQLDIKYNRPDKILEVMGKADTGTISAYRLAYYKRLKKLDVDTSSFADDYSVPEFDFVNRDTIKPTQYGKTLKLHVSAKDGSYKLDKFNVWVNETPIFGLKGISIRWRKKQDFDTTISIILSQGNNRIEGTVINTNGTESYKMPLIIKYSTPKPEKERLYFVGIGIDHYNDAKYNLEWSVKDIRDMAKAFKLKYGELCIVDTLFDKDVSIEKVAALKAKLKNTTENDKVILAYSGHGLLSKQYDYFLSTYYVNFKNPVQKGLPYEAIEELLDKIPARKKLVLIDACHSGEVDKEEMQRYKQAADSLRKRGFKGIEVIEDSSATVGTRNIFELMQEIFVNVGRNTGATVISAAGGMQLALEKGEFENGVFTYSILELMKQLKTISVSSLKKNVSATVSQLTEGLQVPVTRSENNAIDWSVW